MSGPGERGLRDAARHLGAVLPHGHSLPEAEWQSRQRGLRWLLWAHVVAIPIISLLFDQGVAEAALDTFTPSFFAVLAQLRKGSRRVQSLIVTVGLLSCSALIVHITGGLIQAYFHFFVMVAALSLYEDWLPFATAVLYVGIQQTITAEIVDYDEANSPWRWALVHSAFIAALSFVCLATWRASARDREAFRSLVESLEEGVVMIDRDGQMVAANPSATRILGMDPGEILSAYGTDDEWQFVDETGQPLPLRETPLFITGHTGEPQVSVVAGLRRRRGETRWLAVSTRAVESDREPPYTIVVSFTDVTEEREAAEALERSNTELSQFAYIASHDLSEPLRMVSSYLGLLRRRYHGRLDDDADEFIEYAVNGAARMRSLIEGLLEYSRAGRGEDPLEPVELADVTAVVLQSLAAAMVEASAQIEIGDLPTVMGNRAQLEQLLQNLVANALKFRRDGRAQVWVRAEGEAGGMAQIAVADGGIGIPREKREQVFEMFQRAHDREAYEGTGIGLAVCRKIVERHGGRIWVDEREGGGTVFRFTLPSG
ncbi:PAS domain S-box protein [Solirubrobacter sp. CPCC 204708]|uniref:histidine kinase n=1 Tax=Solirubrobacter deserti TaxID=2282478 RepID=A0ABT4RK67_9ACTN|nr:ATP-binding protein [Solirubrobacter deserti]MBE2316830.1 PAS domain S-box protein [Solirubrobacter deserti]MDA0138953.1 ATP-binding protein [Solirubrobacter deserti]